MKGGWIRLYEVNLRASREIIVIGCKSNCFLAIIEELAKVVGIEIVYACVRACVRIRKCRQATHKNDKASRNGRN